MKKLFFLLASVCLMLLATPVSANVAPVDDQVSNIVQSPVVDYSAIEVDYEYQEYTVSVNGCTVNYVAPGAVYSIIQDNPYKVISYASVIHDKYKYADANNTLYQRPHRSLQNRLFHRLHFKN